MIGPTSYNSLYGDTELQFVLQQSNIILLSIWNWSNTSNQNSNMLTQGNSQKSNLDSQSGQKLNMKSWSC